MFFVIMILRGILFFLFFSFCLCIVISRTGFIETLEETLGFTPKVCICFYKKQNDEQHHKCCPKRLMTSLPFIISLRRWISMQV